jgi:hypothetical protein
VSINQARGIPLFNANARVSKNVDFPGNQKLAVFAEFYNLLNRANFGNMYNAMRSRRQPTTNRTDIWAALPQLQQLRSRFRSSSAFELSF